MILWAREKFRALQNSPMRWMLSDVVLVVNPACPISCLNSITTCSTVFFPCSKFSNLQPMPFSGDRTKVKAFLQECLVYINMNKEIYTMDKLKIGFVLSHVNKKEAKDWRELYLENIEDPATGKLVYPTFSAFLTEVCKAFWSVDQVQDAIIFFCMCTVLGCQVHIRHHHDWPNRVDRQVKG